MSNIAQTIRSNTVSRQLAIGNPTLLGAPNTTVQLQLGNRDTVGIGYAGNINYIYQIESFGYDPRITTSLYGTNHPIKDTMATQMDRTNFNICLENQIGGNLGSNFVSGGNIL